MKISTKDKVYELVRKSDKFDGFIVEDNGKERFIHTSMIVEYINLLAALSYVVPYREYEIISAEGIHFTGALCNGHSGSRPLICIFTNDDRLQARGYWHSHFGKCPNGNYGYKYELNLKISIGKFKIKIT